MLTRRVGRGLHDRNRITLVCWPLTTGRYSVAPTCCPLMIDSYGVERPDNPTSRRACMRRGETTGCNGLHTVEDIIYYTRLVAP
jgi:hypothetical protein